MKRAVIGGAILLIVCVAIYLFTSQTTSPPDHVADSGNMDASTALTQADVPDIGISGDVDAGGSIEWLSPEPGPGELVALVDGTPVTALFLAGAAGVYPPVEFTGESVALPTPAAPISGEPVASVELYAASADTDHAYWGDVTVDSDAVALEPSGSVGVEVVGPAAQAIEGATVRIARQSLGLVVLDGTSDASGKVTFDKVPRQPLHIWVEAPGYPSVSQVVDIGEHTVTLEAGAPVSGIVSKPNGDPAADVLVSLHAARGDANPFDAPPVEIVKTNLLGEFRVDALVGDRVAAVVAADSYAPSASAVVSTGDVTSPPRLRVTLQPALQVDTTVVASTGEPVRGAVVRWVAAEGPWGGAARTDREGRASFSAVPRDATVVADYGRFSSPEMQVPEAETERVSLQLTVEVGDGPRWRYRVVPPDDVVIEHMNVVDSAGARCAIEQIADRDYELRGCGEGGPTFEIRTNHGLATVARPTFEDGGTVKMPSPVRFEVTLVGTETEPWFATKISMVGPRATSTEIERAEPDDETLVVSGAAYPGDWKLAVSNPRIGLLRFIVVVQDGLATERFELVELERLRVRVVDRYAAPVTGAYVMLFDDDKLVDVSRSAGQLPVEFLVRPPFDGTVLAVDPRRGEGMLDWGTADGVDEARIRLRDRVLFHRVPASRPTVEDIAERLGARLVESESGFVLDVETGSAAEAAGLQRRDGFVTAWPQGEKLRVVVYRKGAGYVDVLVP